MINPTFIPNPLYIYKYVHSSCDMIRATPIERSIHIYMDLSHDCNEILIGCFLIWILQGTSIMYASLCTCASYYTLVWLDYNLWRQRYMNMVYMKQYIKNKDLQEMQYQVKVYLHHVKMVLLAHLCTLSDDKGKGCNEHLRWDPV